jgi:hypothetical protein
VATLGYSDLMTYLIQAPPYLFAYIFVLAMSWSVGRHMEHCWHIIATSVFGIVGVVIVIATLNPGLRYFGMFFMVAGPFAGVTYVSTLHLHGLFADYRPGSMSLGRQRTCPDRGRNVAPSSPSRTVLLLFRTGSALTSL